MELFKTLSSVLSEGEDVTLVIRKTGSEGKLVVSVLVNNDGIKDEAKNCIVPLLLKGTADELDEGFIDAVLAPVKDVVGLHTSMKAFEDSKKAAEKKSEAAKAETAKKKEASSKADKKSPAKTEKKVEVKEEVPVQQADDNEDGDIFSQQRGAVAETAVAETETVDAPEEQPVAEAEPVQVQGPVPAPTPVPEPVVEASAPEAKETIGADVQTLWKRGKELYGKGDYKGALRVFEQCRSVAKENQYATIDKVISNCAAKLSDGLFS